MEDAGEQDAWEFFPGPVTPPRSSLERAFLAIFPPLDGARDAADQVLAEIACARKQLWWRDDTVSLADDENLWHWANELEEWLADARLSRLPLPSLDQLRHSLERLYGLRDAANGDALSDLERPMIDTIESLELDLHRLAERAFGESGALFLFELAAHSLLPNNLLIACSAVESKDIALLLSEPAPLAEPFIPTVPQTAILRALDGRALKKTELAAEVFGDEGHGNRLYRPRCLTELRERNLVAHKNGVGFYRPDAPPSGAIT